MYQAIFKLTGNTVVYNEDKIKNRKVAKILNFEHLVVNTINKKMDINSYFDLADKNHKTSLRHICRVCEEKIDINMPRILTPELLEKLDFPNKYMINYIKSNVKDGVVLETKKILLKLNYPYKVEDINDFKFICRTINEDMEYLYEPINYVEL